MAVSQLAPLVCRVRVPKMHQGIDGNLATTQNDDDVARVVEEIQIYMSKLYSRFGENFQIPGKIPFEFKLKRHGPGRASLRSLLSAKSEHGDRCSGVVEIHASSVNEILKVLVQLEVSSFNLYPVQNDDVPQVQEFFSANPSLRSLWIHFHLLKEHQEMVLGILKTSKSLSRFDIGNNVDVREDETMAQGLNDYIRAIPECSSIETLVLSKVTVFPQETLTCIANILLDEKSNLKCLDMSDQCREGMEMDIVKIAQALRSNSRLQEWNLGGRRLATNDCILELARALECNTCLKRLDLCAGLERNDRIAPDAWVALGHSLIKNTALEYLDISNNHLSKESWMGIADGLKRNTSLLTLKASSKNYITDTTNDGEADHLLPIFEMLRENTTLQTLELRQHNLETSTKSIQALSLALTKNTTLKKLNLEYSNMTDQGVAILSRALPNIKGLEHLNLNYHNATPTGARAFAQGIKDNYSLLSIEFGQSYRHSRAGGYLKPLLANGLEREYHEIQYYARLNRKGRRCLCEAPLDPSLWPLVLARAALLLPEKPWNRPLVRRNDVFAGSHDTSIDAVYFLLRNVMTLPIGTAP